MKTFGGPFGRSPFGPLREHMTKATSCANALGGAMEAFLSGNEDAMAREAERIRELERAADGIKVGIRDALARSRLKTAVRDAVLELLAEQDEICDQTETVADMMELRCAPLPDDLAGTLQALTSAVQETVRDLDAVSRALTDFDGDKRREVRTSMLRLLERVREGKETVSVREREFNRALFRKEPELGPLSLVFLWRVSRHLALIADHAENTSETVRRVILR